MCMRVFVNCLGVLERENVCVILLNPLPQQPASADCRASRGFFFPTSMIETTIPHRGMVVSNTQPLGIVVEKVPSGCTEKRSRCGEQRLSYGLCSCSDDCLQKGDCCVNYKSQCQDGGKTWLDQECEEIGQPQCPAGFSKPPVILISMDGFRAGYLKAYGSMLPVLSKLRRCGTSTSHMRPVYPSKTFPNHYSIVTGLYPESHGIVDNKMYDVGRNALFSLRVPEKNNPEWYQGEPVSGHPMGIPFDQRVSTLFEWLKLPQGKRPDFYTLYLEEPDAAGHQHGPDSKEVKDALKNVDQVIGSLMEGLKQRGLHRCVNLVLLSDHGMEEASCSRAAYISNYQSNVDDFIIIQGPAPRIRPKRLPEDFFTFDYKGLVKNLSCRADDQPMRPYMKEDLPKRLHFANNVRIEAAHLYMRAGCKPDGVKYCKGGFHGSDNIFDNMQAVFIGYGPHLKHRTTVPPFENIEVYNLLCDLLGIPPSPNNGTHGSLNHLLKRPVHRPVHPAQLSHDAPCGALSALPMGGLGCNCSSVSPTEVRPQGAAGSGPRASIIRPHFILKDPIICSVLDWTGSFIFILGNSTEAARLRQRHLPYGTPRVLQENAHFCLLYQADYVNGFSRDVLMPLWVSYTLPPPVSRCLPPERISYALSAPMAPHRRQGIDTCLPLVMAEYVYLSTEVWTYIHTVLVQNYSRELNGVNIVSGPIFDKNYDGRFDTPKITAASEAPIPTHFFVILTSCADGGLRPELCAGPLQVRSFVLPHRPDHTETCASGPDYTWVEAWMLLHVSRVRDVELLSGLSFYQDRISVEETLQLKTFLPTNYFQSQ
uniref:Ectonucleotide pyrophosphatase/phosphodiesterase 1 n=1 Tax=Gadus morhua TaxID=8049 RepID=A0A8C5AYI3_GADMO